MTNALKDRLGEAMAGPPKKKQADLARACGVKQPSVNDWLSGKTKSIEGANLLRAAKFLGVRPDWLATGKGPMRGSESYEIAEAPAAYIESTDLTIAQYDAGGSMGAGRLVLEDGQPGIIKSWLVDHEWLRLNVRHYTSTANLCIVTGFGPSMRPRFNPGDPLLMDRGINTVETDGVYFFRVDDCGYIKQLQRIPGERGTVYRARSYNPDYEPFDITKKMDFEVFGKILTIWKSEQV